MYFKKKNTIKSDSLHGIDRHKVLNTHINKYWRYVSLSGSREEFESLIINEFLHKNKTASYCIGVYITLIREWRKKKKNFKKPFDETHINALYNKEKKISECARENLPLFDNNGQKIQYTEINRRLKVKESRRTHIQENDAELIIQYCEEIILKYLYDKNIIYTTEIELCFFIYFLSKSGMRKGELLKLTLNQCDDLITGKEINLHTKTGTQSFLLGQYSTDLLYRFINRNNVDKIKYNNDKTVHNNKNQKLFKFNYYKLRRAYKKLYVDILKKPIEDGSLFHSWRTLFAKQASSINAFVTQNTMHHKNINMTNRYIRNQLINDNSLKKKLLTEMERKS